MGLIEIGKNELCGKNTNTRGGDQNQRFVYYSNVCTAAEGRDSIVGVHEGLGWNASALLGASLVVDELNQKNGACDTHECIRA